MAFWNARHETMPDPELDALQLKQLKALTHRLYDYSPFYRERMTQQGVHPDDVRSLEDVSKLPFMYKRDLRDIEMSKLFMAPNRELVRFHASSGTTGTPTIVGYTHNDITNWAESLARGLASAGLGQDDILQVAYTYGLFTGGLGLHYGAERLGATVVPASTGNSERQLEMIRRLGVTAIACTPSYLMHLGEVAGRMKLDVRSTKLRTGILGAEPWSEGMRQRMEDSLGVKAINIYGTSELSGPLWCECTEQDGMHVWRDQTMIEVVNPETGERLGPGEKGELVVTMLLKEAVPIVRYRTGDIATIEEERCACGRTHPRLGRITGRVDDMLIVRGINVFPSQIEYVLMQSPELGNEFQIVLERTGALDDMLVKVELRPAGFKDNVAELECLKERISSRLRNTLSISAEVELVEPGTLPRFEGKAKRVVDKRRI
ncbi:MAG TPA: phenylacetate--CoA ligase [Methanomassiliicoccales archaeon]|nr:phenylacetate--CoA ligase [Methanomassiliicoccales archaeon]